MNGILNVYKEPGFTSHDVVAKLRGICKQKKIGRRFATTKGVGHGFGLVRIDSIIEKLDGYLSRNSEDGAFTTEILIPQL